VVHDLTFRNFDAPEPLGSRIAPTGTFSVPEPTVVCRIVADRQRHETAAGDPTITGSG
jgi:hypothetical protein